MFSTEFILLHCFYVCVYLLYKKNRGNLYELFKTATTNVFGVLLNSPLFVQFVLLLQQFRAGFPTIKRENKALCISYTEKNVLYKIYIPYDRKLKKRKYQLKKGETTIEINYPAGVALLCEADDLGYDEITEV
jgi:hypothetical protein